VLFAGAPSSHPRDALVLGVRAEEARLVPTGVPAKVTGVEYLGADTLVDTRIGGEPFIIRLSGRASVDAGQDVFVGWDAGATHWFDARSSRRISNGN